MVLSPLLSDISHLVSLNNKETVKFHITSSPRERPSNWVNSALIYSYTIVAVSLHKIHIRVVKSLVKIAAVS